MKLNKLFLRVQTPATEADDFNSILQMLPHRKAVLKQFNFDLLSAFREFIMKVSLFSRKTENLFIHSWNIPFGSHLRWKYHSEKVVGEVFQQSLKAWGRRAENWNRFVGEKGFLCCSRLDVEVFSSFSLLPIQDELQIGICWLIIYGAESNYVAFETSQLMTSDVARRLQAVRGCWTRACSETKASCNARQCSVIRWVNWLCNIY